VLSKMFAIAMIKRALLLVMFSIIGGLTSAFVHATSVGPDAGPKTLALPGVISIAVVIGAVAGLLISPVMIWAMKGKHLGIGIPFIYAFAWSVVLGLNLMQARFAVYISFGLTIAALCAYRLLGR
jgi:hypothetical protein